MLSTNILFTFGRFEVEHLINAVEMLAKEGWRPAILETQRTFLKLAGVSNLISPSNNRSFMIRTPYQTSSVSNVGGEVFFQSKSIYYIFTSPKADAYYDPDTDSEPVQPFLEVGLVSMESGDNRESLRTFAELVERSLRTQEEHTNTPFDWKASTTSTPHIDKITAQSREASGLTFTEAEYTEGELQAAEVLTDKNLRDTLIELSRAGFARERDILSRKSRQQDQIKSTISSLTAVGLLNTEFLLECRKTNQPLTRLKSKEQLKTEAVGSLLCPSCNSAFKDELLSEGYSLSSTGRTLTWKSHWMTIWITDKLIKLGIPKQSIIWNISDSGEEVDILVDFLEALWIFELKDREFGSGDAYALNYRQVRYKATKAIIITTEKVSKDARRVFDELAKEGRRVPRSSQGGMLYIEGLDSVEKALSQEIFNAELRHAVSELRPVFNLSGYNISPIISAWLENASSIQVGEEEIRETTNLDDDDDIPF